MHLPKLIALLVLALATACDPPTAEPESPLRDCRLVGGLAAKCGTVTVPEDRTNPDGKKIALRVAVVPSFARVPEPDPLFLLVGGPGQSATHSGAPMAQLFRDVRKKRDIVLVDQRGTGESNALKCDLDDGDSLAEMLDSEFDPTEVAECARQLKGDARHYTTPVAMDDLDAVRAELGYDRINLWGGSYGTRAALVYMRRHPERVRRVVLDGVAPLDIKLVMYAGRDAQRALDLLLARCDEEGPCRAQFGDAKANFRDLLTALETAPRPVVFAHPRTGEEVSVTVDRDVFATLVRTVLYAPTVSALLPLALQRASDGEWAPLFAAFLSIQEQVGEDLADGMFLSIVCAEDVPQITATERAAVGEDFLGPTPLRHLVRACEMWPAATMPPEYFEPIETEHPTLILSGNLDPVTPPSWGELVAGRLPNSVHHVVPAAGHGVSALPCAASAIANFLESEQPLKVGLDCEGVATPALFSTPSGAIR